MGDKFIPSRGRHLAPPHLYRDNGCRGSARKTADGCVSLPIPVHRNSSSENPSVSFVSGIQFLPFHPHDATLIQPVSLGPGILMLYGNAVDEAPPDIQGVQNSREK